MKDPKVAIVGSPIETYETQRFLEEGRKMGLDIDFLDCLYLRFEADGKQELTIDGKDPLDYTHLILKRITVMPDYRTLIQEYVNNRSWILNGNSLNNFAIKINKLSQEQTLVSSGIKIPHTYYFHKKDEALKFAEAHSGNLIAKPIRGTLGKNIIRVEDRDTEELNELIEKVGVRNLLFQEDLATDRDYRVLVIGKEVFGIMERRKQNETDIVSNIAQGGIGTIIKNQEISNIALKAAEAFECDYVGVDVMFNKQGVPHVLELNFSAHFKGFEAASGANVAGKILEFIVKQKAENGE